MTKAEAGPGIRGVMERVMAELRSLLERINADHLGDLGQAIARDLAGEAGPPPFVDLATSQVEDFFVDFFRRATEIQECIDALGLVSELLCDLPDYDEHSRRVQLVRYHREHRLHEMYMLQQRIQSLLTWLVRRYRNAEFAARMSQEFDSLGKEVHNSLEELLNTRGRHVHEWRFRDDLTRRLVSLGEIGDRGEVSEPLGAHIRTQIDLGRLSTTAELREEHVRVQMLVDSVFDRVADLLISDDRFAAPPGVSDRIPKG